MALIAADAGFNDFSTFHHRFRKVLGVTPRRLRAAR
jgi:AraC-like DNA-binding protein